MDNQKLKRELLTRQINKKLSSFDPRDYKDRYYFNKEKNKATGKRRRKTGKVKKKTQKYLDLDKYFLYLPRSKKNTRNKFRKNSRKIKINKAAGGPDETSNSRANAYLEYLAAEKAKEYLEQFQKKIKKPGRISPRGKHGNKDYLKELKDYQSDANNQESVSVVDRKTAIMKGKILAEPDIRITQLWPRRYKI